MKWFRFYSEVLNDPKVQELSPALFKHWVNILCLASQTDKGGELPDLKAVAFALRVKPSQAADILEKLADAGLVNGRSAEGSRQLFVHNWTERQRVSDDSATRKRRERDAKHAQKGAKVTGQSRDSHALDTDTDKRETETIPPNPPRGEAPGGAGVTAVVPLDRQEAKPVPKPPIYPDEFERFWKAYPRKVNKGAAARAWATTARLRPPLAEVLDRIAAQVRGDPQWRKDGGAFIPYPATWLNGHGWANEVRHDPATREEALQGFADKHPELAQALAGG